MGIGFHIAAVALIVPAALVEPSDDSTARFIDIAVHNEAAIAADVLERARVTAESVFAKAGVQTAWFSPARSECVGRLPDRDRRMFFGSLYTVRIVRERLKLAGGDRSRALGATVSGTRGVIAFYSRIELAAERTQTDPALLLGHVVVHELGHLLLARVSHSAAGIMRSTVDIQRATQGRLIFSDDEARRIRARAHDPVACESYSEPATSDAATRDAARPRIHAHTLPVHGGSGSHASR